MRTKFSVHGRAKDATNFVEIGLSQNIHGSQKLTALLVESIREIVQRDDLDIWLDAEGEGGGRGRIVAEVPTGMVFQNDDCRQFKRRYNDLFNRRRSLAQQK